MIDLNNPDIVLATIAGSLLLFVLCVFIFAFGLLFKRRRKQYQQEKELLKAEFKSTLLKSQLEIKEQTLEFLSKELHDNIGQIASVIKIYLTTLDLSNPKDTEEKVSDASKLIRALIKDLKILSSGLNSQFVKDFGLAEGLQTEMARLNKINNFSAELKTTRKPIELDPERTIILFRMAQEIINNTLKHSQASKLFITLSITEKFLILEFKDNGIGFNWGEKLQKQGAGLKNLQYRANLLNAELNVTTSPSSKGTSIDIKLPL